MGGMNLGHCVLAGALMFSTGSDAVAQSTSSLGQVGLPSGDAREPVAADGTTPLHLAVR